MNKFYLKLFTLMLHFNLELLERLGIDFYRVGRYTNVAQCIGSMMAKMKCIKDD